METVDAFKAWGEYYTMDCNKVERKTDDKWFRRNKGILHRLQANTQSRLNCPIDVKNYWIFILNTHVSVLLSNKSRNNNEMQSRDVKTEVFLYPFRFEIPRKHLTMLSLGTLQKKISSRNSPYCNELVLTIPNFDIGYQFAYSCQIWMQEVCVI